MATASGRGAQRGAKSAGLRARQIGTGTKLALEKAPQIRRELRLFRRELRAEPTTGRSLLVGGLAGLVFGAAGAYFLDPKSGSGRRDTARNVAAKVTPSHARPGEGELDETPQAEQPTRPTDEEPERAESEARVAT
jgi:hypothetical protein